MDAGLAYETVKIGDVDPGWSIMVRVSNGPHPDTVNPDHGWRINANHNSGVNAVRLTWVFNSNNKGYLKVVPIGTGKITLPILDGDVGIIRASHGDTILYNQNNLFVKIALGIAQNNRIVLDQVYYELDGTTMVGNVAYNATVTTNAETTPISWTDLSDVAISHFIDQSLTGYSPAGKDMSQMFRGALWVEKDAKLIVNFPDIYYRVSDLDPYRYDRERVDYYLRKPVIAIGKPIYHSSR